MTHHRLKTWPGPFQETWADNKPFELRKNDRNFQVGDTLELFEWAPDDRSYLVGQETGRTMRCEVLSVLSEDNMMGLLHLGLGQDYVIMGIRVTAWAYPGTLANAPGNTPEPAKGALGEAQAAARIAIEELRKVSTERDALRLALAALAEEVRQSLLAVAKLQERASPQLPLPLDTRATEGRPTAGRPPAEPMTAERKVELEKALVGMQCASNHFYGKAVQLHIHPFIEMTGLMNEYIKLCHNALAQGIDFGLASVHTGVPLPAHDFEAKYIGEKLECIFGPTFARPKLRDAFLSQMFPGTVAAPSVLETGFREETRRHGSGPLDMTGSGPFDYDMSSAYPESMRHESPEGDCDAPLMEAAFLASKLYKLPDDSTVTEDDLILVAKLLHTTPDRLANTVEAVANLKQADRRGRICSSCSKRPRSTTARFMNLCDVCAERQEAKARPDLAFPVRRSRALLREALVEMNEEALFADGLDDAFAGIAQRFGQPALAAYDREKVIQIFMSQGMTEEEAEEFFEYNTIGAWVGACTPVYLDLSKEES